MTFDWWTFGLQTVNVLILIWLLGRFFWRPVAAMIEGRHQQAQSLLDQAQADRAAAAKALAEAQTRSAGFAQERETILAQARAEAAEARRGLLAEAEAEAAQARAAAQEALARQSVEAEQAFAAQAGRLAVQIAGKLAARLDGEAVRAAFLRWLVEKLAQEPDSLRQSIAQGGALDVISAEPLDGGEQARIRAALSNALGDAADMRFSVDPELIAGLELRTPHFALANSWRADLANIRAELTT
jgi:F-type H+-transporting ATPase subunit b